jgi:hypothetical protein
VSLLRNRFNTKGSQAAPPQRPPSQTGLRRGPYARLERLWRVLFASLLLDPLLIVLGSPQLIDSQLSERIAIVTATMLLPFIAQESLYRGIAKLRNMNARQLETNQLLLPVVAGLLLAIIICIKVLQLGHLSGVWGLTFSLLILLFTLRAVVQSIRNTWNHTQHLKRDGWTRLELWEQQLVVLSLAPQALARSISLCGALSYGAEKQWATFLAYFTVSTLFLGMLRPARRFFVGFCRKCKQPVPIVFVDIGGCLRCDEDLRRAYEQGR